MTTRPPCSFCGASDTEVHVGFRALICTRCIEQLRVKLAEVANSVADTPVHHSVAGQECVLCERILSSANFSMRRWIFGICDACACSVAKVTVSYRGVPAQSYEF